MHIPQVKEECKANILCPLSMEKTAHCGKCDFDPRENICAWIKSSRSATEKEIKEGVCPAEEETVYTGSQNHYSFTGKKTNGISDQWFASVF